jgi:hypothetical protein
MKYTVNDIEIEKYVYNDSALSIFYYVSGDLIKKGRLLPNTALMISLKELNLVRNVNLITGRVQIGTFHPWIDIENYMDCKLDTDMAKLLVIHYLNNRSPKPAAK